MQRREATPVNRTPTRLAAADTRGAGRRTQPTWVAQTGAPHSFFSYILGCFGPRNWIVQFKGRG